MLCAHKAHASPALVLGLALAGSTAFAQAVNFGDIDLNSDSDLDSVELYTALGDGGLDLLVHDTDGNGVVSRDEMRLANAPADAGEHSTQPLGRAQDRASENADDGLAHAEGAIGWNGEPSARGQAEADEAGEERASSGRARADEARDKADDNSEGQTDPTNDQSQNDRDDEQRGPEGRKWADRE